MLFKRTALRGPKGARWQLTGNVMLQDHKRMGLVKIREAAFVDRGKYTPHFGKKQQAKARALTNARIDREITATIEEIADRHGGLSLPTEVTPPTEEAA